MHHDIFMFENSQRHQQVRRLSAFSAWANSLDLVKAFNLERNQVNEQNMMGPYPEELLGGAWVQCPVGYLCLFGQILGTLYGWDHPLHGEEGCQVGRVGGDDDEGEEPPDTSNDPAR